MSGRKNCGTTLMLTDWKPVCMCVKEGERDYANMFLFSENSAHVNEDCRKQPNLVGMLFL